VSQSIDVRLSSLRKKSIRKAGSPFEILREGIPCADNRDPGRG